jgi:hypothetical protein
VVYKSYFCQGIANCLHSSYSCITALITDLKFILNFIKILALSLLGSLHYCNVSHFRIEFYRVIMLKYDLEVVSYISQHKHEVYIRA